MVIPIGKLGIANIAITNINEWQFQKLIIPISGNSEVVPVSSNIVPTQVDKNAR